MTLLVEIKVNFQFSLKLTELNCWSSICRLPRWGLVSQPYDFIILFIFMQFCSTHSIGVQLSQFCLLCHYWPVWPPPRQSWLTCCFFSSVVTEFWGINLHLQSPSLYSNIWWWKCELISKFLLSTEVQANWEASIVFPLVTLLYKALKTNRDYECYYFFSFLLLLGKTLALLCHWCALQSLCVFSPI